MSIQYLNPLFSGEKLLGANGSSTTETTGWFKLPPGVSVLTFQFIPKSAQDADITLTVQGALQAAGGAGKYNPFTIKAWVGSDGNESFTPTTEVAYDLIRVDITKHKTAGAGSHVLVSGR